MATQDSTALPEARAVHNLERYFIARSNAHLFYNVVTGPRLRAAKNNSTTAPHPQTDHPIEWAHFLARPLTWLIQEHLSLSVVVRDHLSTTPWFVRLPSVDLAKLVRVTTVQTPDAVTQVLEHEHNTPFDLSDWTVPLWRIVVVRVAADGSFFLLFSFHHIIGDGRSSMALTEQLHDRLNLSVREPLDGPPPPAPLIVPSPKNKDLHPPIELLQDCRPRPWKVLRFALSSLAKLIWRPRDYWAGEVDAQLTPHITQFSLFRLSKEETSLVLQTARQHQNTVQAMLFAAAVFAVQSCFIDPPPPPSTPSNGTAAIDSGRPHHGRRLAQTCSTPVALRDLVQPKIERWAQGLYTSEHDHRVVLAPASSFWQVAADYRQSIVDGTQTKDAVRALLEHFGMLRYLPNYPGSWEAFMTDVAHKEPHGRRASLLISNLGRGWDVSTATLAFEDQPYLVEDALFSQDAENVGMAFAYSVVTANGVLTATNTWQAAAFHGRERGEWYTRETKRILLEACRPERASFLMQDVYENCEPCAI